MWLYHIQSVCWTKPGSAEGTGVKWIMTELGRRVLVKFISDIFLPTKQ